MMCKSRIVKSFSSQARISIGKWPPDMENTLTASIRGIASREPKLSFMQVQNFKKEGSVSFPAKPRSPKSDIGSYVYRTRENRRKK